MQCVFENSSVIKNIVCSLADGVENLNMHATSNGISVCATNVSNTDMRELALTTDYFKEYTYTQDCVMGLNMPLFKKFMSTAGPTSSSSGRLLLAQLLWRLRYLMRTPQRLLW